MNSSKDLGRKLLDTVGAWTLRKYDIISYYAEAYSNVLTNAKKKGPFKHAYIDGYAGAGLSIDERSGSIIKGSALRVLDIKPPFDKYVFVEIGQARAELLRNQCRETSAEIITGDANIILPQIVFPQIRYEEFWRAFCLLDPYNLEALRWETITAAASQHTIDILLHFPIMDINRSVLRKDGIDEAQAHRLSAYWGDESWREIAYTSVGLLPLGDLKDKVTNEVLVMAFCERLRKVAGFEHVMPPIPMKNYSNAEIYHLIFASHEARAGEIMKYVVQKFKK
jgi:three-Cys-motif partner protein